MISEIINWIETLPALRQSSSTSDFIYDHMESQSGECLPVIYTKFDSSNRSHFSDRAQILDFLLSTSSGRILDFGPGDGWPSLLIAPYVKEVIGVEGSQKRLDICNRNAKRLGLTNVEFEYVPPGTPLPFPDCTFDGAMAASSIEQTPDPYQTLKELFRVLKPGGKLRLHYEDLDRYKGVNGGDYYIFEQNKETHLIIYRRKIEEENVRQYRLTFNLSRSILENKIIQPGRTNSATTLNPQALKSLEPYLLECCYIETRHPSFQTFVNWMRKIGFRTIRGTYDGGSFASELFDNIEKSKRPDSLKDVDNFLKPLIKTIINLKAPVETSPWIIAKK